MSRNLSVDQYFDSVQNLIKDIVVKKNNVRDDMVEQFVKDLMTQQPDIQLEIKKITGNNYESNISVEKTAEQIIDKYFNHPVVNNDQKVKNLNTGIQNTPDIIEDRGSNKMESRIMKFREFVNEKLEK